MSAVWIILLAGAWWALVGGRPDAWGAGLVAVAAAQASRAVLGGPAPRVWRPAGLLRFIPYFLWKSLNGGIDVARRALHPALPIAPELLPYSLALPAGPERVFFVRIINLLPGTFSADLRGETLLVHVLDRNRPLLAELRELESHVAALFGVDLRDDAEDPVGGRG